MSFSFFLSLWCLSSLAFDYYDHHYDSMISRSVFISMSIYNKTQQRHLLSTVSVQRCSLAGQGVSPMCSPHSSQVTMYCTDFEGGKRLSHTSVQRNVGGNSFWNRKGAVPPLAVKFFFWDGGTKPVLAILQNFYFELFFILLKFRFSTEESLWF